MTAIGIKKKSCHWFRNAIIYHILIDRFAGYREANDPIKPVFIGGNLKGITDKLPYLYDLGINALWLSPVYKTTTYHGYHVTDFYTTDKRFGSENDLKNLINQAHEKNIRVILDFVPNHCSRHHPFFIKALSNKRSKYRKWFYFNHFNNKYLCFLDFHDLPKINLEWPDARDHIIEAAKYWIKLGADGFRLDHAIGPTHNFWKAFSKEIKLLNSEAVLIGEAWLEGIDPGMLKTINIKYKYLRWLLRFNPWQIEHEYIGELDGVLDFYIRHQLNNNIAWKENPVQYESVVRNLMNRHYKRFPIDYYLPSFIENHDMNRFLYDAGQNRNKLEIALKLQFSLPHPPIIYYGTESGLTHDDPVRWDVPFSDIYARQPMPWNALDYELIDYCKELINNRKKTMV